MTRIQLVAAFAVCLAGCRGILGVESTELDLDSGVPDAAVADGATPDATMADASTDANHTDTSVPHDSASGQNDSASPTDSGAPTDSAAPTDSSVPTDSATPGDSVAPTDTGDERAPEDAQGDSADAAHDAAEAGDARPDSAPLQDSGIIDAASVYDGACAAMGAGGCPMCCRTTFAAGLGEITNAALDGCLCGDGGACDGVCEASICGGEQLGPDAGPVPAECGMCINVHLPACPVAIDCEREPSCAAAYYCIASCPAMP